MRRRLTRGFTLIELMVAITIGSILAMVAAPMLSDYLTNSRLRESGNTLVVEAMYAQSEAVKRNGTVRMAVNGSTLQLIDLTPQGNNAVIRTRFLPDGALAAAPVNLDFGARGTPVPFPATYTVDISINGVVCSADYRCPSLRVDAGGAVRLCGDRTTTCP